jgi:hypothetical protein
VSEAYRAVDVVDEDPRLRGLGLVMENAAGFRHLTDAEEHFTVMGTVDPNIVETTLRDADEATLSKLIDALARKEAKLRAFRLRVEALRTGEARVCPSCGRGVVGRADRVYCSTACRVRAHRAPGLCKP